MFLLRYEDLVITPYATLDILLNFLELPPEPCMDAYLENHVGKKRQEHIYDMTFFPWLNFRNNCLSPQKCYFSVLNPLGSIFWESALRPKVID